MLALDRFAAAATSGSPTTTTPTHQTTPPQKFAKQQEEQERQERSTVRFPVSHITTSTSHDDEISKLTMTETYSFDGTPNPLLPRNIQQEQSTTNHLRITNTVDSMEEPPRILSSLKQQQQQHSTQDRPHKPLVPLKHVRATTTSSTETQASIGAPTTQSLCPSMETETILKPQTVSTLPPSTTPSTTTAKPVPMMMRNAMEHEKDTTSIVSVATDSNTLQDRTIASNSSWKQKERDDATTRNLDADQRKLQALIDAALCFHNSSSQCLCAKPSHCAARRRLYSHVRTCQTDQCLVPGCHKSRSIWNHFVQCDNPTCRLCHIIPAETRLQVRWQSRQQQQVVVVKKLGPEQPLQQITFPQTPKSVHDTTSIVPLSPKRTSLILAEPVSTPTTKVYPTTALVPVSPLKSPVRSESPPTPVISPISSFTSASNASSSNQVMACTTSPVKTRNHVVAISCRPSPTKPNKTSAMMVVETKSPTKRGLTTSNNTNSILGSPTKKKNQRRQRQGKLNGLTMSPSAGGEAPLSPTRQQQQKPYESFSSPPWSPSSSCGSHSWPRSPPGALGLPPLSPRRRPSLTRGSNNQAPTSPQTFLAFPEGL